MCVCVCIYICIYLHYVGIFVFSCLFVYVQNPERLTEIRTTLRERMLKSPLMDGVRAARKVEEAYRTMWSNFVNGADGKT